MGKGRILGILRRALVPQAGLTLAQEDRRRDCRYHLTETLPIHLDGSSARRRNYAPFSRDSSISGVSPRACALRPASSRICCRARCSPPASSRSQRPRRACILRFSSAGAELYACAVCGSSGIVMVGLTMAVFYDKTILFISVITVPTAIG